MRIGTAVIPYITFHACSVNEASNEASYKKSKVPQTLFSCRSRIIVSSYVVCSSCTVFSPAAHLILGSLYWFSSVTVPGHCFSQNSHQCITSNATWNLLIIKSCQVHTTSRWGIRQLGISFGSIFPLSLKSSLESYSATQVTEGILRPSPGPWQPWVMTSPSSLSVYFLFLALQD